jgi:hypothetical protein
MINNDERKKNLARLAEESAGRADEILEEELRSLLLLSRESMENLRPRVTDAATYERLIEEVQESARRKESARQFQERLMKGGKSLFTVAKEVLKFI